MIGWTLGMSFAISFMLSKGFHSLEDEIRHTVIGAMLGLVIGALVPLETKRLKQNAKTPTLEC